MPEYFLKCGECGAQAKMLVSVLICPDDGRDTWTRMGICHYCFSGHATERYFLIEPEELCEGK